MGMIPGRRIIVDDVPKVYRCSFCGKTQREVERLIAGPGAVYICNECVDPCKEIMEEAAVKAHSITQVIETDQGTEMSVRNEEMRQPKQAVANIVRAGHLEFRVTDLERARAFYVDLLGFVETSRAGDRIYLRGYEESTHHCLVLHRADSPGVSHMAYRVGDEDDLERLAAMATAQGLPMRWLDAGEEEGQGRALRLQDPLGLPLEFYAEMTPAERLLQRFDLHRGAQVMRMDHFNCQVPDVQRAYDWYTGTLGFRCSEYTATDDTPERLWAAWLHRKGNVHDLALMNGVGPRVHHGGYWLPDAMAVVRTCDILAGAGAADCIERGPGRHGISNALFIYLRDPDGNRIELYASDYSTVDPDFVPIRWSLNDKRRQTLWGHHAPRSWFTEASLVESVTDGTFLPTHEPALAGTPTYVH